MIALPDSVNGQIVDFIKYSIKDSSSKNIDVANRNILTHPAISKERIEFFSYGFYAKGINVTNRRYDEDLGALIVESSPYYNFTIKIRIVSTPEKTLELASLISRSLSSFDTVDILMPDISILNERARSSNLMVSGDGHTATGYYIYDIDIPSVIEEHNILDIGELAGYFTSADVEYNI